MIEAIPRLKEEPLCQRETIGATRFEWSTGKLWVRKWQASIRRDTEALGVQEVN